MLVSRNYFDVLGVPIVEGRGFTEEESQPGRDIPVVVATHSYWQRSGSDPALVGKTVRINERDYTVIGITPRGFTGTMMVFGPELFFPFGVFHSLSNDFQGETARTLERPDAYNLFVTARLKNGVSLETANARLTLTGQQLERAFPAEYRDARVTLAPQPRFGVSTRPSDESVADAVRHRDAGTHRRGADDRVPEPRVDADGARSGAQEGVRHPPGARRRPIADRAPAPDRRPPALSGRRIVRRRCLGSTASTALVGAFSSMLPITIVLEGAVSPAVIAATVFFCLLATSVVRARAGAAALACRCPDRSETACRRGCR